MSSEITPIELAAPAVPAANTPAQVRETAITVTINVTAHGKPEDAETLAQAVRTAVKILVPNASVG